jgi:hypothetical protein
MKKFLLAGLICIHFFASYAQENESPQNPEKIRWGVELVAGISLLPPQHVLYRVVGEFRGIENKGVPVQLQAGPGICADYKNIRVGLNFYAGYRSFKAIVHRYKIYYSPGGNAFGGNIYDEVDLRYFSAGATLYTDYFFRKKDGIVLGIGAAAIYNSILKEKYPAAEKYMNIKPSGFNYFAVSAGPYMGYDKGSFTFYLKPHAQFVVVQDYNAFPRMSGIGFIGGIYHF